MRALLQYRNTQLQDVGASPAQLLYGRRLRDHMPSFADALKMRPEWIQLAEDRERALAKRHLRSIESYNHNTRNLVDLKVGDHVLVQNQTGVHPTRWDKTGRVMEIHPHSQYTVRMDGSGRCSTRNRRFLRSCLPFMSDTKLYSPKIINNDLPSLLQPSDPEENTMSEDTNTQSETEQITHVENAVPSTDPLVKETHMLNPSPTTQDPATNERESLPASQDVSHESPPPLRRSQRKRKPPPMLSVNMRGKTHSESCRPCPS